ncbi:MAG: hypothetical protein LBJ08_05015 [Bifidobacteriaceae bacterium]|jgi:AbrB family looped-hinge helix DNA binding protein|nr:hypothetical protein [Bifidobacteriaceae bacterium]
MIITIDKAGRLVIPKALRDQAGIVPGEVEVTAVGNELRVGVPTSRLVREDGHLVLPDGGTSPSPEEIRGLRLGNQR